MRPNIGIRVECLDSPHSIAKTLTRMAPVPYSMLGSEKVMLLSCRLSSDGGGAGGGIAGGGSGGSGGGGGDEGGGSGSGDGGDEGEGGGAGKGGGDGGLGTSGTQQWYVSHVIPGRGSGASGQLRAGKLVRQHAFGNETSDLRGESIGEAM